MQGSDLNLRHLRAFAQVCHCGSISAAAETVHLSQSAITQALAKLERDFEVVFFSRSSKGMFPTDQAHVLLKRVDRAFELLRAATRQAQRAEHVGAVQHYSHSLTSTQLRALVAVARHGNFSVAARAMGVSQPSLYRAAKDLEALSRELLYRKSSQGIELTPAAKLLARAAQLVFAELGSAISDIKYLKGDSRVVLSLGSLPLARGTILPLALNRLTALHPQLQVQVIDNAFDETLHALRHGEIDLMLGALRSPPPADDVQQEPLFEDRLGVYCGPGHPLLSDKRFSKATLASYPWVVARRGAPSRSYFDSFFADVPDLQRGPVLESGSLILVRGLLQESNKLTMISRHQVKEEVRTGSLCPLAIDLGDKPRMIGVSYRANWQSTKTQQELLEILRDVSKTSY